MRPVTTNKGGKGNYLYDNAFNYNNATFTFQGGSASDTYFNTTTPTMQACFDVWTTVAQVKNKQIKRPVDYADRDTVATALANKIGDYYREAATPLAQQLGTYCSYCEMYLPDKLEVEHVAPKSQYPQFCLSWDNFLLSCGPCNGRAAKDSIPSRADAAKNFNGGQQPNSEIAYYNLLRANYVWPDIDDTAYRLLEPQLEYYSNGQKNWLPISFPQAVRFGQSWVNTEISTRTVTANIFLDNTTTTYLRSVRVTLVANSNATYSADMIKLCKLNDPGGKNDTISDRRLIQRTELWFTILKSLKALSNWKTQTEFDEQWDSLLDTAKTQGFYSLWVQILNKSQMADPSKKLLVSRFVQETFNKGIYPNTDTTNVP